MSLKKKESTVENNDKVEMPEGEIVVDNNDTNNSKGLSHLLKHEAENLKAYYALQEQCESNLLNEFIGNTIANIEKITLLIKDNAKGKDKA